MGLWAARGCELKTTSVGGSDGDWCCGVAVSLLCRGCSDIITAGCDWSRILWVLSRACGPEFSSVGAQVIKLLIQQIHPHVRVERNSGMCVARDLYELWGRSLYTRMFVAPASNQFQPLSECRQEDHFTSYLATALCLSLLPATQDPVAPPKRVVVGHTAALRLRLRPCLTPASKNEVEPCYTHT